MERNFPVELRLRLGNRPGRSASAVAISSLFVGLLAVAGCSASNSSETMSDSVSSPFKWSSGSSDSSSDGDSAYRQDVSDYTVAFARSGSANDGTGSLSLARDSDDAHLSDPSDPSDLDAFRSGLRRLAEQRGISNWEEDGLTCASIGLGLRHAELAPEAALAFGRQLLGGNARAIAALRAGYATPLVP